MVSHCTDLDTYSAISTDVKKNLSEFALHPPVAASSTEWDEQLDPH